VGTHINNFVKLESNEKILLAFNYKNIGDARILTIASKKGVIKRTNVKDLEISKVSKISTVMKLSDDDDVVSVILNNPDDNQNVLVITRQGNGILYPISQISIIGKNGAGVRNLNLKDGDEIKGISYDNKKRYIYILTSKGVKKIPASDVYIGNRTNQPKSLFAQKKDVTVIEFIIANGNENVFILSENKK
jgi:DNA gyrase/topoisomerase IV subunit A